MFKYSGYLVLALILISFSVTAQDDTSRHDELMNQTNTNNFVDTVTHVYNLDSLDKAKISKDLKEKIKASIAQSEADKIWIKKQMQALTTQHMHGRGYVKGGIDSAGIYIMKKFKELKLKPATSNGQAAQAFGFPVNTFPGKMMIRINGDSLRPCADYIIEPSSQSFKGNGLRVKRINLNDIVDRAAWKITLSQLDTNHAYVFDNTDLFCSKILNVKRNVFLTLLPRGCFIIPQEGRLQWSQSRDTIAATVFYVRPGSIPKVLKWVDVNVTSVFLPHVKGNNIVACVPGVVKDSFIAFTAHYDHLGTMGDTTVFTGANDDASGIAMMLFLASFYAKHPPHYTMLFIAFAGEEASLMGSQFFVKNPMVPLKNIKFLVNMNMMGDATTGLTVVNAMDHPTEFGILKQINDREKYVPTIWAKPQAANSDHYYFSRAGIPAFFIYGNGGKGYYHDIYDKPKELTANNIDGVAKLLIAFAKEIN